VARDDHESRGRDEVSQGDPCEADVPRRAERFDEEPEKGDADKDSG
jgi:hypothetical protein